MSTSLCPWSAFSDLAGEATVTDRTDRLVADFRWKGDAALAVEAVNERDALRAREAALREACKVGLRFIASAPGPYSKQHMDVQGKLRDALAVTGEGREDS